MSDGLGDVFDSFFNGVASHQEIQISPNLRAIVTDSQITFKQYGEGADPNIATTLSASQFKAFAELLLPNIQQKTTIDVAKVREKLTPIRKD